MSPLEQSPSSTRQQVFDVLGLGYGPANVGVAIAIAEHNRSVRSRPSEAPTATGARRSTSPKVFSSLGGLQESLRAGHEDASSPEGPSDGLAGELSACFLEQHAGGFKWHPGMMLEGSKMQISFLKDLATVRNPSSEYTFLSFLHAQSPSRLLSFISLSTFAPTRREFSDYLTWAANKAARELDTTGGHVAYGERVLAVEAVLDEDAVEVLRVTSENVGTGERSHRYARNLVLSTGGSPHLPKALMATGSYPHGRIAHTSQYLDKVDSILRDVVDHSSPDKPIRLAVIGAGQSAAEVFLSLRSRLADLLPADLKHRPVIEMHIRKSALRPSDDSPFSNEVFDPGMSQAVYRLGSEEERAEVKAHALATNYSVVNPKTLEHIYEAMYDQKVELDAESEERKARLLRDPQLVISPLWALSDAHTSTTDVALTFRNTITHDTKESSFDAVFCGTGYERQGWKKILFADNFEPVSIEGEDSARLADLFNTSSSRDETSSWASSRSLTPDIQQGERRPSDSSSISSKIPSSASLFSEAEHSTSSASPAGSTTLRKPAPELAVGSLEDALFGHEQRRKQEPAYTVTEDYQVTLASTEFEYHGRRGTFKPTIWTQGSNEATHGISDSLLSVIAVRSQEVLEGLLARGNFQ